MYATSNPSPTLIVLEPMKKLYASYGIGCLFLITLLFCGCGGKWKRSTELSLRYELVKADASQEFLRLDAGSIYLGSFKWEGKREQSGDVEFQEAFENTLYIDVEVDNGALDLMYDIPQGTYSEINTELTLEPRVSSSSSVVLQGKFYPSGGDPIRFDFETDKILIFDLEEVFPAGEEEEISFIKNTPRIATIRLALWDWFGTTTENMFLNAERTMVNGEEIILISQDSNSDLHDEVILRIGDTDIFELD